MLLALCLTAAMQAPATSHPQGLPLRPALAGLAARAPGKPAYGVQISHPSGQFIFTNLRYTFSNPRGVCSVYRVTGPAGMGPYRLGVELGGPSKYVRQDLKERYQGNFYDIKKAVAGGAAQQAGLDDDWSILSIDGQNFGWNTNALIAYITTRPTIEVLALKAKGWGIASKQKTFQINLRKLESPMDPTDGTLIPEMDPELRPLLDGIGMWSALVAQRASLPRFKAVPVALAGAQMWAVRGVQNPHPEPGQRTDPIYLEFWQEEPGAGLKVPYPAALWNEPLDGLRAGRALRVLDRWYRIQEVLAAPNSGQLQRLALTPWAADAGSLLSGATLAVDLGPGALVADRESLEQLGNDALVEWKTRTLPGLLASQSLEATEDLVVRLEKGLLKLDLDVKGIRARLDAAARAEIERKAQTELAARDGKPEAQVQASPATESERLADLLDQRKAILMAILGSAKQALANLRR